MGPAALVSGLGAANLVWSFTRNMRVTVSGRASLKIRKKTMKITLTLLGSAVVVATMVSTAMASDYSTQSESAARHERNFRSARASYEDGRPTPIANNLDDQSPFGKVVPWPTTGMSADDQRQSVNGN
jgi:hypothetical protein